MAALVLDSGGLIAFARGEEKAKAVVARAIREGARFVVPAVVIAETTRGSNRRDARINQAVKVIGTPVELTYAIARTAGKLLAKPGLPSRGANLTIDAIVVAHAMHLSPAALLTSDIKDLTALAAEEESVLIVTTNRVTDAR